MNLNVKKTIKSVQVCFPDLRFRKPIWKPKIRISVLEKVLTVSMVIGEGSHFSVRTGP